MLKTNNAVKQGKIFLGCMSLIFPTIDSIETILKSNVFELEESSFKKTAFGLC